MASLAPKTTPLTREQAIHLLKRTTFGPTRAEIDSFTGMDASSAVDLLLTLPAQPPAEPIDPATGLSFAAPYQNGVNSSQGNLRNHLRSWWMDLMLTQGTTIREKMVYFFHTHFTSRWGMVGRAEFFYFQFALFRYYALGNFKSLSQKICRDQCMLRFLDGYSNTAGNPNENFGREFLELYTIGKGDQIAEGNYTTYTEADVQEAARVFTGYKLDYSLSFIDPDTGLPRSSLNTNHHDSGDKTFSAAFQNQTITGTTDEAGMESELTQIVEMVFSQEATAEHIVRKLYRFFVYYQITAEVEQDIIQPLSTTFRNGNYELLPIISTLLKSQHFFDEDDALTNNNTIGAIIKSPIELLIGTTRYFQIPYLSQTENLSGFYDIIKKVHSYADLMDMELLNPPLVAGWPAYHQEPAFNRNWISSSTFAQRNSTMRKFVSGVNYNGNANRFELDLVDFLENGNVISNPADPNVVVTELTQDLFPFGVDQDKHDLLKETLVTGLDDFYWTNEWIAYTAGATDDSVVRPRLDNLARAILQSVEYHLQ